jgi:formate-dependent nitrite reductase cytochrome c552 subunit
MIHFIRSRRQIRWLVFFIVFGLFVLLGGLMDITTPVSAAPPIGPSLQQDSYAGSQSCAQCHENIHSEWIDTRHAHAFSSPIFQRDWEQLGSQTSCLHCHTTGFDPSSGMYAEEGVTCESCHGPFQPGHPAQLMPITPDAELCSTCHKSTTDEWHASVHSQEGIQCQACHNPHSQTPKAESVTALCQNCHKERGESFTHSTHADSGLQCSNCHMYTPPRDSDPIMGLVPTGHTFSVGSDACIRCHQDTVHTRDELIKLSGEEPVENQHTFEDLHITIHDQEQEITNLEAANDIRLYTGLIQGAIIGLVTGGAAAWVVSRRIQVVEVDEDE